MKLRSRQRAQKVLAALLICGALAFTGKKWIKLDLNPRPPLSQPEGKKADQLASKLKATSELIKHLQDEARARRDVVKPPTAQQRKSASEVEIMAAELKAKNAKSASEVETMAAELKAANELVKQLQHEARSAAQQLKSVSEVETMAAELKAANEFVKQLQHEARRDAAEKIPNVQNHSSSAESLRRCDEWGRFPLHGPKLPSGTLRYSTANSKEIQTCTVEHMRLPPVVPTSVNAYYLYLGNNLYECGVLMAAWRIRRFDKVNDIIVGVPASYKIDVERFVEQVPNLRVLQITEQTLPMVSNGLWKETSYKFVALGLVQYRRVVFLDADSMVLRDLGHLFDIPCEVHFMAPVYHAGDTPGFTTALFAVTPSAGLYRESMQHLLDRNGVADMEIMNDFWDHKLKGKVGGFNYVRIFPEVMLLPSHYLLLDNCFRMAGHGTNNGVEPWAKGRLEEFCVSAKVVHFTAFVSGGMKAFTHMDLLEKVARGSFPSSNLLHPCMSAHYRQYYIDSQQVCHDQTVHVPAAQWTTTSREADKALLESLPNQAFVSAAAKSTAEQAAASMKPRKAQLSAATAGSGKDCASITDTVRNGVYNAACCGMKRTNCDDCVCGRKECCGRNSRPVPSSRQQNALVTRNVQTVQSSSNHTKSSVSKTSIARYSRSQFCQYGEGDDACCGRCASNPQCRASVYKDGDCAFKKANSIGCSRAYTFCKSDAAADSPPCCATLLFQLVHSVVASLESSGIEVVLKSGTCVGAMRDADILPWDPDADICIPSSQAELFKQRGTKALEDDLGVVWSPVQNMEHTHRRMGKIVDQRRVLMKKAWTNVSESMESTLKITPKAYDKTADLYMDRPAFDWRDVGSRDPLRIANDATYVDVYLCDDPIAQFTRHKCNLRDHEFTCISHIDHSTHTNGATDPPCGYSSWSAAPTWIPKAQLQFHGYPEVTYRVQHSRLDSRSHQP